MILTWPSQHLLLHLWPNLRIRLSLKLPIALMTPDSIMRLQPTWAGGRIAYLLSTAGQYFPEIHQCFTDRVRRNKGDKGAGKGKGKPGKGKGKGKGKPQPKRAAAVANQDWGVPCELSSCTGSRLNLDGFSYVCLLRCFSLCSYGFLLFLPSCFFLPEFYLSYPVAVSWVLPILLHFAWLSSPFLLMQPLF